MEKTRSTPATIRLAADESEISLAKINHQIFSQLQQQSRNPGHEKEHPACSFFPFCAFDHQHRPWPPIGDFRDGIMAGLTSMSPLDESACTDIRRILTDDLARRRQMYTGKEPLLTADDLAPLNSRVTQAQSELDSAPGEPLSRRAMREYARIMVKTRIRDMLDTDVTVGRLVVSVVKGKPVVQMDHLVAWAVFRKIKVEQDALPGCSPLVHESFQRLHRQLSGAMLATDMPGAAPPDAAPLSSPTATQWDQHALRKLWDESKAPGMTQKKLAEQYGLSRQRIGQLLENAQDQFGPRKADPFSMTKPAGRRKNRY